MIVFRMKNSEASNQTAKDYGGRRRGRGEEGEG